MPGLAVVVMHHVSGLARDNCVNTFAFDDDVTDAAVRAGITQAIVGFYNDDADAAVNDNAMKSVGGLISPEISRVTPTEIKVYNLAGKMNGEPHGSAIATVEFSLDAATAASVRPAEVGIALSFRGDYGVAQEELANPNPPPVQLRPRSSRRGRVFIGPVSGYAGIQVTGTDGTARVSPLARACLGQAGLRLRNDAPSHWSVWSRKLGVMFPITTLSVDDAFDTQRRRGPRATLRQTF